MRNVKFFDHIFLLIFGQCLWLKLF